MDPYIDRTREAVRKIYDTITKEDLTGDVSFGLIAFRDNPQAVPDLDYLTHTYVTFIRDRMPKAFSIKLLHSRLPRYRVATSVKTVMPVLMRQSLALTGKDKMPGMSF